MKRYPLTAYFLLACALSWSGVLLVIGGPTNLFVTKEQAAPLIPRAIPIMLVGPSVAAIVMTRLLYGPGALRTLLTAFGRWRASPAWYGVGLLTAPTLAAATLLPLLATSPVYRPALADASDPVTFVLTAFLGGLVVAMFEELGWTGFALPVLRRRYGVLTSGLLLGLLWGGWHGILALWGTSSVAGVLLPALMLPELVFYFLVLPLYRVLMVWAYDRSNSVPVVLLMHAGLTAAVPMALMPPAASGPALTVWYVLLAIAFAGTVAILRLRDRRPAPAPAEPRT